MNDTRSLSVVVDDEYATRERLVSLLEEAGRMFTRELVESALAERLNLADLTALYTQRVLAMVGGNKVRAARILGINRRTLYRRAARRAANGDGRKQ